MRNETNLENLNAAFKKLAIEDNKVVFIGEDIASPYEGAFKVEKGLQELIPDRVISTPISEESFTGMAAGMAVRGYKPIVDLMFSDFMTLSFDIVLNFASKYPEMYGERKPFNMIIRSANGGYRGYGPTHSQSMQKFFMGMPNVCVYEMSPFHDNKQILDRMLNEKQTCIFLEEKTLYSRRVYRGSKVRDLFTLSFFGENNEWAYISIDEMSPDAYIICPGGMTEICLDAAEQLMMEEEISIGILVPAKLYPCDLTAINEIIVGVHQIYIAEESTSGADWGDILLSLIYNLNNHRLNKKVILLSSDDSVIPASYYLENKMLLSVDKIVDAIKSNLINI